MRIALLAALPALLLATAAPAQAGAGRCDPAPRAEREMTRLINVARHARGLRPVRISRALRAAARAHSCDMIRRRYFDHDQPGRPGSWDGRVRGYLPRAHLVAEILAWGSRGNAQARVLVRWWLRSAPHRAVLLDPHLRLIGIGARRGGFRGEPGALIATADFATL